jgi:myo-inositol-1(or 4)-monophosphatase
MSSFAPSFVDAAAEIAREAGALQMEYFGRVQVELKGQFDIVTEADRASEKLIVSRLRERFPAHAVVAEEGFGRDSASAEYRWYVDPLDGTTNFAHGFPMFNATLALEHNGELVAGVIFDPLRNEMFSAELGAGAFLNGSRISVSHAPDLDSSLLATGFPSRKRHRNVNVYFFYQMAMMTHGVRRAGSAALDLAYVACGRLDGYWEFGLSPWDMAAGVLLVREAGGVTSDMYGHPVDLRGTTVLTDNGHIHEEILREFAAIFRGEQKFTMPVISSE